MYNFRFHSIIHIYIDKSGNAASHEICTTISADPYVQVENEYGFCGNNKPYLRNLIQAAKRNFGEEMVVFTTDPPTIIEDGSIKGDEVFS